MGKSVWIVPLLLMLASACTERDTNIATPEMTDEPDIVVEEAGITAAFYSPDKITTRQRLSMLRRDPALCAAARDFENSGYRVEEEHSFFFRGRSTDGSWAEITVFAMSDTARRDHDAVYLFHINSTDGRIVIPIRLAFEKTHLEPNAYQIDESVWIGWAGTPPAASAPPFAAGGLAAKMSITEWLKCVGERIAAGAVACALTCRYVPVVYLKCLAACATGHVAQALVSCTIQAL